MKTLFLASASPRRREILAGLGLPFSSVVHEVDERVFDHREPAARVLDLALAKAENCVSKLAAHGDAVVLAADTLVCDPLPWDPAMNLFKDDSGAVTLGKARDRGEAARMMALLSGRTHVVHTGLALVDLETKRRETAISTSRVSFAALSGIEIETYLDSGEWEGVAGAYRVQGLAALFIERIEGSWSGIVGLPIHELYATLSRLGLELSSFR